MNQILKTILSEKGKEVAALRLNPYFSDLYNKISSDKFASPKYSFFRKAILAQPKAVIAEIKRKSPSKTHISDIPDPVALATKYIDGGASAMSILTDSKFFGGSLDDLKAVKNSFGPKCCPILRKDFMIDPFQIVEAIDAGADCILLIVAALSKDKTKELLEFTKKSGIDALVEIHTSQELDIALDIGADMIGINNRNLDTFEIDMEISKNLVKRIPDSIVKVSESGIKSSDVAKELFECGFNSVLVGEFLASSANPEKLIREMIA